MYFPGKIMEYDRGEVKLVKKKSHPWQSFQKLLLLHTDFPGSGGLREYVNTLFSITNTNGEALKGLKKSLNEYFASDSLL